jgi:hypothetical protein
MHVPGTGTETKRPWQTSEPVRMWRAPTPSQGVAHGALSLDLLFAVPSLPSQLPALFAAKTFGRGWSAEANRR